MEIAQGSPNQTSPPSEPVSQPTSSFGKRLPKPVVLIGIGLLVAVLLGVVAVILRRKKPAPSREVTLVYWGLWEPSPVMNGVIAQFEKTHPGVKIKYEFQLPRDYKARLTNALSSGKGPDIFRFHQTWLPTLVTDLSPVPQAVKEKLGLERNYFSSAKRACQYQGEYYALPLMIDNLALYYNKDLLGNRQLPRTWWGLQNLAIELTQREEDGRIKIAGVALGTANNIDHFSDILGLMFLQSGADLYHPNNQTVAEVLEYYTLFSTKYHVWDETLRRSTDAFAAGKLAFYFAPSWRYFEIKARNPQLNFGITTVPQLPKAGGAEEEAERGNAELTNINWGSFWVEGVWRQTKHPQEAWEFLSYLASAEGLRQLYTAAANTRDFGEIYPVVSLAEELKANPYLRPFVVQAETADWWYLCSATHDVSLNDAIITYFRDAVGRINEGSSPQIVLATLEEGVREVLQKQRLAK